jgi:nitroimidazol reductase NimA-like FMN-containing flavoprotein (pyridoxamine 5'-phosphate oxidase superfamily)
MTADEIIDANRYMTLATADAQGTPWASPVWFAHADYREFYWASKPEARHSRNLAERPELAIVIFDSSVSPDDAAAVYITATAEQVTEGIEVYNERSVAQGLPEWTLEDVTGPARFRLFKATATEQWTLGEGDLRVAVHRTASRRGRAAS